MNNFRWHTFLKDIKVHQFIMFPLLKEVHKVYFVYLFIFCDYIFFSFSFFVAAYRCEILNREFMFSDQLETVISGLYGHDIAEVLIFNNIFNNNNNKSLI